MRRPLSIGDLLSNKIVLLVFCIIVLFLATSLARHIKNYIFIRKEFRLYENKIAKEEERNSALAQKQEYMQSDFFREETARLKFGMQKEGESLIVVKINESATTSDLTSSLVRPDISNFRKWWRHFSK